MKFMTLDEYYKKEIVPWEYNEKAKQEKYVRVNASPKTPKTPKTPWTPWTPIDSRPKPFEMSKVRD